ncbi:hypothetical protein PVAP13_8NG270100 [Panicum virgatum]|uniref:Uncharacterized protein n=1 Tax=Panicum virgatum TaxID=38727 RepID=A0A8T0PE77_PANVG|nr:hypothetical protein PVAP13_8NG270100 [Panicum virgatum]
MLHTSVRGDIKFLTEELEGIQAALLKVSEAPIDEPPDIQVKLWAKEVKELSYDIEDRVDTFTVRVDGHEPSRQLHGRIRGFVDRSLRLLKKAEIRHDIGLDIRDIKRRIKEVSERRDRYKVDNVSVKPVGPSVHSLRLSALYRKAAELIGTEEKAEYLVTKLELHKTVSIVGFGGLGKTTLAKLVYEKLKVQFHCRAFVSVSLNPNMISLFKNMLHQLGNYKNVATWEEAQLIEEIREFLRNKRYLIVIDDIWSKSAWEMIQYALIENECGSRVITTTRILDVAKCAGGIYELPRLTPADSRKLFNIRIFGTENKSLPKELEEVYNSILKKCGGVPLAIITIASMLASKMGKENAYKYWSKVYRTMGSGLEDSPDYNDMRRILLVKDSEVSTEYLIWQWVGEGFVLKEQGRTIYEVGQDYVDQLINRSMIEAADFDRDSNKVSYCRIHDMVLDLVTCLSNEDGFQTTLDGQRTTCLRNRIRRLSLQTRNEEDVKLISTMSMSHMRSLTVFKAAFNLLPALSNFPVLRVLDLSGCRQVDNHHFKDICNLFHLRFLGLWLTSITEIPEEIGNLQFLQVLDLSCTKINEVPTTFVQLRQLVCLRFDHLKRLPERFGDLKSLERLEGQIYLKSPTIRHELGSLTELRRVHVNFSEWDESNKKHILQFLSNLVCLEDLKISGYNGDFGSQRDRLSPRLQQIQDIRMMGCIIPAVPSWISSLSALSILSMALFTIGEEDLRVLGSIPSLSHLEIMMMNPTQGRNKKLVISNEPWKSFKPFFLSFEVQGTMDQFGDLDFGLDNLSSLAHVAIDMYYTRFEDREAAETAIRKAIDMNPNKPTLKFGKVVILMQALKQTHFLVCFLTSFILSFEVLMIPRRSSSANNFSCNNIGQWSTLRG